MGNLTCLKAPKGRWGTSTWGAVEKDNNSSAALMEEAVEQNGNTGCVCVCVVISHIWPASKQLIKTNAGKTHI